jgi:hypothetical protein
MRDYRRSRHACGECIGEGQKYEDLFHDEFPDGFREAARLDSFTANSAAQADVPKWPTTLRAFATAPAAAPTSVWGQTRLSGAAYEVVGPETGRLAPAIHDPITVLARHDVRLGNGRSGSGHFIDCAALAGMPASS